MTRPKAPAIAEIDLKEVEPLLERMKALLPQEDFTRLKALVDLLVATLLLVTKLVRQHGTTIARLRRLFGLSGSEKFADVAGEAESPTPPSGVDTLGGADTQATSGEPMPGGGGAKPANDAEDKSKPRKKVKGHGRVPASAYGSANHIAVPHAHLHPGDRCPDDCGGKVYRLKEPAPILRIFGQPPLRATCWDCEQWRCNGCGKVYTARPPEEAQGEKYDETASSMMALLSYGTGVPFHRLERLQRHLETPVAASTQWEVVKDRVESVRPVYNDLVQLAAQGSVVHSDDSHMPVLEFMGKRRAALLKKGLLPDPERTGLFTTAIVSLADGRPPIALFFTGRKHAGENLGDVLDKRPTELPPPILMGDALSRNVPVGHKVLESNCIAHGRRKIVDEIDNYPVECRGLLKKLRRVYRVDDLCRTWNLSPQQRLEVHQRWSASLMAELERSMQEKIATKQIEPNSGIGHAFNYFLKRWEKFTLFLRVPGAPLDNNLCERVLKMAIKHRNGSLFYRTLRGASVGDLYMSVIHTAELYGANPFDYLTALQRYEKQVAEKPAEWLPWNYKDTLARLGVHQTLRPASRSPPRATPTPLRQPQQPQAA